MKPRLASDLWVAAYRARLEAAHIPAYVTSKGDATAGAIIIKCAHLDGTARAFHRSYDADGERIWTLLSEGEEAVVDEILKRERRFDPDIWIIEIENANGTTLLDEDGLT